jgi:hypothetical protein
MKFVNKKTERNENGKFYTNLGRSIFSDEID